MKTNILNERESDKSIGDALAKGGLVWAPVYAVTASTVIYGLTVNTANAVNYVDTLMLALLIFSPLCMAAEAIRWVLTDKVPFLKAIGADKEQLPKLPHFVPPGAKMHRRHA
jgi:hypothetical protein